MKTNILFFLSLVYCGVVYSQDHASRQTILLDINWSFSGTDTAGAERLNFDDSNWRRVNLPHDWSIEQEFNEHAPAGGNGGYLPTGAAWYRNRFSLPVDIEHRRVSVVFDGVYQNSDVWLNGHHLGHYPNGFVSFYYDLSPFIKAGENIIAVRVDNSLQPNCRWYTGSGIYRNVWLNITDPLHLAQWGTSISTPVADSLEALVLIYATIENKDSVNRHGILTSLIQDANGNEMEQMESPFCIFADQDSVLLQKITISSPMRWSPDHPNMYTLCTRITNNGVVIDEVHTPFGIREMAYDVNDGFLLNGKPVKIKGVCLHHDAGCVGTAVPEAMWVRRLGTLKQMGCNAIRTSHNPVAPEFLDLCDRMGFMVMNEILDEWRSGKVEYGYHQYFDQWVQHDLVNFIRRDRNHPSVIMWSAGNEIIEQKQENGHEILKRLMETFHREDPTRPVTTGNDYIGAHFGPARLPFLEQLDIVGYNYVDRWDDRAELMYSIDRQKHPDWKMVGTESSSIPGKRGNYFGERKSIVDSSLIIPAQMTKVIKAEKLWKFISVNDYVIGDFIWTGIDYIGESEWPDKNASYGVIDLCGFKKDAYYFYQSQWTDEPMIHLFPHWNWKGKEGSVIPVMAFSNCDTVELFLNGKSFGMKSMQYPRPGYSGDYFNYEKPPVNVTTGDLHLTWDVPFEPGTLRAQGRKGGKVVCEENISTTGLPVATRLTVDRKKLIADSRDVAHVKIELIDENGLLVPDANNAIQVLIEGPGSLIGLDNGNPKDHTVMKSNTRSVYNGLALAVVQSGSKPGNIKIKVISPGMRESVIEVGTQERNSQKPGQI